MQANGGFTLDGVSFFRYSTGQWTPTMCFIRADGFKDPGGAVSYYEQHGYYTKIGNQVTVWYHLRANVPDNYRNIVGYLAPCITGLPYVFNNPGTDINLSVKAGCSTGEWPNGFISDVVPLVVAPTFPKPYDTITYELGYNVPLRQFLVAGYGTVGTWIADGTTAMLYGTTQVYGAGASVPPYFAAFDGYCQINNTYIDLGSNYDVEFQGSFSYTTDS